MALHGEIKENSHTLACWEAVRVDPVGPIHDLSTVCTYRWTYKVIGQGKLLDGMAGLKQGRVEHRYGDGPAKLAIRVLAAALVDSAQLIG